MIGRVLAVGETVGTIIKTSEESWVGLRERADNSYIMIIIVLDGIVDEFERMCAAMRYVG
ncbi:MAG: hypothetical protein NTNFB02_33070 [Nitrospira sp.]